MMSATLRTVFRIAGLRTAKQSGQHPHSCIIRLSLLQSPSWLNTLSFHPMRSTIALTISTLLRTLISCLASHRTLARENLAHRQQIAVLPRSVKCPHLKKSDRLFRALLSRVWTDWTEILTIVKPETVIRWRREGFRLYWTWKSRRTEKDRPAVASEG